MQNTLSNSINVPARERGGQNIVGAIMPPVHHHHHGVNKKMMDITNMRNNQARSLDKYAYE